jgi:glutathione synthase/RimK-type ligase-like ATP-grasp enzyme
MILLLGAHSDTVTAALARGLRDGGNRFLMVDEDRPDGYLVSSEASGMRRAFRVRGGDCDGTSPVGSIFVRHSVPRHLDSRRLERLHALLGQLNRMLAAASCPSVNLPANAYSNYSKPYQVGLLAAAGFDVPRTLLTNVPEEARRFYDELAGQVIFKGVSNVATLAQVLTPERLERLKLLPHCPTLFQEYVAGVDYRVHVVGERAFVTRLRASNEDYRRSALAGATDLVVEPAALPAEVTARCIAFTRQLGLAISGIDFKESRDGRLVALELNPYPQFTFYEGRSGQPITRAVIDLLAHSRTDQSNVFA